MIDTIRCRIPIDQTTHDKIERMSMIFSKRDNEQDKEIIRICTKQINAGSFDRHISLKLDDDILTIEFSVPKFVWGHNVFMVRPEEVLPICQKVRKTIEEKFCVSLLTADLWQLSRVDFCYAWKLPNQYLAEQIMEIFMNLQVKRKKAHFYDTSVTFSGRTQNYKFYLKNQEFWNHDFKELNKMGLTLMAYDFLKISEGVIRFEITLRGKSLAREFYGKCDDNVIMIESDIFTVPRITALLNKYMRKILKVSTFQTMDNKTVFDKLTVAYGLTKARNIYTFYRLLFSLDRKDKEILDSFSQPQRYRYIALIRSAGIGISSNDAHINFDLSIPSDAVVNSMNEAR